MSSNNDHSRARGDNRVGQSSQQQGHGGLNRHHADAARLAAAHRGDGIPPQYRPDPRSLAGQARMRTMLTQSTFNFDDARREAQTRREVQAHRDAQAYLNERPHRDAQIYREVQTQQLEANREKAKLVLLAQTNVLRDAQRNANRRAINAANFENIYHMPQRSTSDANAHRQLADDLNTVYKFAFDNTISDTGVRAAMNRLKHHSEANWGYNSEAIVRSIDLINNNSDIRAYCET